MPIKRGQILLITVFSLTFALFSLLLLLAPIRDKLIRIKEMESVYQAVNNGVKGIEASLLDVFWGRNLDLDKQPFPTSQTQNCGGLTFDNQREGTCIQIAYSPKIGSSSFSWTINDKFKTDNFIFFIDLGAERIFKMKNISDGFLGRVLRTVLLGSGR